MKKNEIDGPSYLFGETFELGEETLQNRDQKYWHQPGISGEIEDHLLASHNESTFENVLGALMKDQFIDTSTITVKVVAGVVYISGKVKSRQIKKLAESIVEGVQGVIEVVNDLTIIKSDDSMSGPGAIISKDLGVQS